jgi:CheY-like chemotaxis protein
LNVLFADADHRLAALVRSVLEPAGHTVICVDDAPGAASALRASWVDAAFVDVDLPGGGPAEALARWRATDSGRQGLVVLLSGRPRGHASVTAAMASVGTQRVLTKPVSLLDLGDIVASLPRRASPPPPESAGGVSALSALAGGRGPGPTPPSPLDRTTRTLVPRAAPGPVSSEAAARLARLWATAATGLLRVRAPGQPVARAVRLRDGGTVDPRDHDIIEEGLRGGELHFEPGPVDGAGDPRAFGALLMSAARAPGGTAGSGGFTERHRFDAPVPAPSARPFTDLPLSRPTRAVLAASDGQRTLGQLVAMLALSADSLGPELELLSRLGLLQLQPPRAPVALAPARPAPARPAAPPSAPTAVTATGPAGPRAGAGVGPAPPPASVPAGADLRTAPTLHAGPSDPSSVTRVGPPSHDRGGPRSTPTSDVRGERAGRGRRITQGAAMDPRSLHQHLQRELQRLEGASPAVVLGVPAAADDPLVDAVTGRLVDRYRSMSDDASLPEPTRELAREALAMVRRARERWGRGGSTHSGAAPVPRELILLAQGQSLVDAGDFARADRVLTQGRDLAIANPDILTWLGVARLQNPERDPAVRAQEAIDMLLLAEQFAPDHDVALRWLARALLQRGDSRRALPRARRLLQILPADQEAARLVQAAQEPPSGSPGAHSST